MVKPKKFQEIEDHYDKIIKRIESGEEKTIPLQQIKNENFMVKSNQNQVICENSIEVLNENKIL